MHKLANTKKALNQTNPTLYKEIQVPHLHHHHYYPIHKITTPTNNTTKL